MPYSLRRGGTARRATAVASRETQKFVVHDGSERDGAPEEPTGRHLRICRDYEAALCSWPRLASAVAPSIEAAAVKKGISGLPPPHDGLPGGAGAAITRARRRCRVPAGP